MTAKILVVDDEDALRKAIAFDLTKKGFEVFQASSGIEAMTIVKREKINLVLSDIRMPNGDGVELIKEIKALDAGAPIVIFMTGFSDLSLIDAYHEGAAAVVAKPFNRKALLELINRMIISPSERWKTPLERVDADLDIELKFPELNEAVKARVVNIGRGGMFVALESGIIPNTDQLISFSIKFKNGSSVRASIQGQAAVRWIRAANEDLPAGIGAEFFFVEEDCRQEIMAFIENKNPKSFIPKC